MPRAHSHAADAVDPHVGTSLRSPPASPTARFPPRQHGPEPSPAAGRDTTFRSPGPTPVPPPLQPARPARSRTARTPLSPQTRPLPLTSGARLSAPSPSPRRAQQSPNPRRGFRRPPLSGAHAQASPSRPTNSAPRPWFSNPPHTRRPQTLAAAGRSASNAAAGKSLGRRFTSPGADPVPLTRCTASQRHPEPVRGDLETGGVCHPPGPRAPSSGFSQTRRRRLCGNHIDPS